MRERMYFLVSMVIYNMVIIEHGNTEEQPLQCLLKLIKLKSFLEITDASDRTCLLQKTVDEIKNGLSTTCNTICKIGFPSIDLVDSCINVRLGLFLHELSTEWSVRLYINDKCKPISSCTTLDVTCTIKYDFRTVKEMLLGEQKSCTPCSTNITDLCTSAITRKPTTTCEPCPLFTTEETQGTTTSSSGTEFLHDRCGKDESVPSDCPGIAVGVGCLGIVIGVIITSTICICWNQRKQPRRNVEGQAMTNKAYLFTGVQKNNDVESKPRQRSVIYSEINDEPTHGNPKISHVAPIIRDTEGKTTNETPNDKGVYNHLNEEINEDDVDDYDHARPVPVQNNEADNAYGKLDKTAAMSKSIQDDKRISSSIVDHDYGELEVVETGGVKRLDNETKKMESDEDVGNEDSDNYFTLEKSQI